MPKKPKVAKKPKAPERIRRQTSPAEDLRSAIKRLAPSAFDGDKLCVSKLAALTGEKQGDGGERYRFDWAGWKDAVGALTGMPPLTLVPDERASVGFDDARSMFLEGDNLEVMKLLRRAYSGKVKMVYIDPPYNTGGDFVYKDNYRDPYREYLKKNGIADESGAKTSAVKEEKGLNGNRHSRWLSMMFPRLCVARDLMRDDGVIFVSIDDNEFHHLRLLMNRVFGEENFVASLSVISNLKGNNDEFGFAGTHEYALVYAKDKTVCQFSEFKITDEGLDEWLEDEIGYYKVGAILKATGQNAPREKRKNLFFPVFVDSQDRVYVTTDNRPRSKKDAVLLPITDGEEMTWRWKKDKFRESPGEVIVSRAGGNIQLNKKQRPLSGVPSSKPKTLFYKPEYSSGNGTAQMQKLFDGKIFANPKPLSLIKDMLSLIAKDDDIVLDFFAGSGTTAHAVMQLNAEDGGKRRFILVQLPEQTPDKSDARKAGYKTIADIAKERIRRAGKQVIKSAGLYAKDVDVKFKVFRLAETALPVYVPPKGKTMKEWIAAMEKTGQMKITAADNAVITEILLAEGYPLEVAVKKIAVKNAKTGKKVMVYQITAEIGGAPQNLYVCLEKRVYSDITWDLGMRDRRELFVCYDKAIPDATTGTNMLTHAMVKTI